MKQAQGPYSTGTVTMEATGTIVEAVDNSPLPPQTFRIVSLFLTSDADGGTFQFLDSDANELSGIHNIGAGVVLPYSSKGYFRDTAPGTDLEIAITGNLVAEVTYEVM